jgi:aerobic carbon-monoxide dehydrogenase small subunit
MSTTHKIKLTVNDRFYERQVEPRRRLADFLREDLGLTGTHICCEHGVCGVCTIALNDKPTLACLIFAVQADGKRITTVEGLAPNEELGFIQRAFWEKHALQCGFCTPGFLMTLWCLFKHDPSASDLTIRNTIDGVLCRCTGYQQIFDAALSARDRLKMLQRP